MRYLCADALKQYGVSGRIRKIWIMLSLCRCIRAPGIVGPMCADVILPFVPEMRSCEMVEIQ